MNLINHYLKGDKVVWITAILLSMFSVLAVYSSSSALAFKNHGGNTEYLLFKQLFIVSFGLGMMWVFHQIPYRYFSAMSQVAMLLSVILLLLTFFVGKDINNAERWLKIPGINMTFQPSDLAKLALIMYIARVLSRSQDKLKDNRWVALNIFFPVFGICALVVRSNFSTAALLFLISLILLFMGRLHAKYLFQMIGIALLGLVFIFLTAKAFPKAFPRMKTWETRIMAFVNEGTDKTDNDEQYQADNAKIAIATGGVIGKGPGNSVQRHYLPQSSSDFIYAIIIEEYGMVGGFSVLFMYLILLFRGVRIVIKTNKIFPSLLAMGCTFGLIFQAFINMAVATNLFPVTGQPLPLLSSGGTSFWFTGIALGILISVSRGEDTEAMTNNETETMVA